MSLPRGTRPFPPFMQGQRRSERQTASTIDKGHGRIERRTLTSTVALKGYLDWPGAQQVVKVERERTVQGRKETETVYYVTSLSRQKADAKRLLELIRGHWGAIENGLHWVRDEVLGEDRCTIFRGHAPQNLAALRNAALNWVRQEGDEEDDRSIASRLRSFTRNSLRLLAMFGYVK